MLWTVIGHDEFEGHTFAYPVEAENCYEAMVIVASKELGGATNMCVVGAVKGEIELLPPCEDSGCVAYASDLDDPEIVAANGTQADDCCDLCMTSGVHVDRTTACGKTIGIECGCNDKNIDGLCGNPDCEDCRRADNEPEDEA